MSSITLKRPIDYAAVKQNELELLAMYALDGAVRAQADAELARRERIALAIRAGVAAHEAGASPELVKAAAEAVLSGGAK